MRALRRAAVLALLLSLGACTVGSDFSPPRLGDLFSWTDRSSRDHDARGRRTPSGVTAANDPDPRWWDRFGDATLTRVMERAISGNLDLQQAVLRVVEARQGEINARATGLPTLNGTASYTRQQLGLRGLLQSRGAFDQANRLSAADSPLNQFRPGLGTQTGAAARGLLNGLTQPVDLFQYGLDASWELDLFGRVRRGVEQAEAQSEAQIEATNDALVSLQGEVAQAYAQLRGAQTLYRTQMDNVRTGQASLDLTQRRRVQGLATELEVEQARAQLLGFQAQLPVYERQTQQAINRLSVLTGEPPGTLDRMLGQAAPLPMPRGLVGIGVPSALARRRPDIRRAEAQLHAATASVGVAVASFYPDVSLTSSVGIRATDASYLTRWASHFYSIGPSVSLPIFQGGRLISSLRMARTQEAGAVLAYRSAVLNALREVEDALVAYRTDRQQRDRLRQTVSSSSTALALARSRYENGLSNFLDVLDAQRTLVGARQSLVQADLALTSDAVALYKALGGGWEETRGAISAPKVDQAPPLLPAALDTLEAGSSGSSNDPQSGR
jgi:multidrug efflux system outer membrane protein